MVSANNEVSSELLLKQRQYCPNLSFKDLGDSVDDTQNTILVLQQRMATLEETNTLLLERIDELETDVNVLETDVETCYQQIDELRIASNVTNQELEDLDGIVESHDTDIQGIGFSYSFNF